MTTLYIPRAVESDLLSSDYRVAANRQAVPVHAVRVSAQPYNCWWPGHQRPLSQTELASYISFDFEGEVVLDIDVDFVDVERVDIRPAAFGIVPEIRGNHIRLTLTEPRHFTVEINGYHHCLHVFAQAPKDYGVSPGDPDVLYFGPGEHRVGLIYPQDGQTVYIHPEAVVYGQILVDRKEGVRILGRGVLDGSIYRRLVDLGNGTDPEQDGYEIREAARAMGLKHPSWPKCLITAVGCHDLVVDGLILRDPPFWTCDFGAGCDGLVLNNLKLIGLWRYNSDGLDLCAGSHYRVRNCFIRSFDDSVVIRARYRDCDPVLMHDIVVEDCVLWCDWGRAIEFWGNFTEAEVADVVFRRCHILRVSHIAIDFQIYRGGPVHIHDVLLEDITVHADSPGDRPVYQREENALYSGGSDPDFVPMLFYAGHTYDVLPVNKDGVRCDVRIHDITARRITWDGPAGLLPKSNLDRVEGYFTIADVNAEGWIINGQLAATDAERGFTDESRWESLPSEDRY